MPSLTRFRFGSAAATTLRVSAVEEAAKVAEARKVRRLSFMAASVEVSYPKWRAAAIKNKAETRGGLKLTRFGTGGTGAPIGWKDHDNGLPVAAPRAGRTFRGRRLPIRGMAEAEHTCRRQRGCHKGRRPDEPSSRRVHFVFFTSTA